MTPVRLLCALGLGTLAQAHSQTISPTGAWQLNGDIGIGINRAPVPERHCCQQAAAVPYLNADYGPLFARIDTFGIKLAPLAAGHLELLTRVLGDGYRTAGNTANRQDSLPIGIGTLQITPVGAFMVNLYHDLGPSRAQLASLLYGLELDAGALTLYPQAGVEYRSANYVHYYDATPAYHPAAASSPWVALFAEFHVAGNWYLNANFRQSWLGKAVQQSPLVHRPTLTAGLLSVSYRFN